MYYTINIYFFNSQNDCPYFPQGSVALLDNIVHNALNLSVRKCKQKNIRLLIPNTNWDIYGGKESLFNTSATLTEVMKKKPLHRSAEAF